MRLLILITLVALAACASAPPKREPKPLHHQYGYEHSTPQR